MRVWPPNRDQQTLWWPRKDHQLVERYVRKFSLHPSGLADIVPFEGGGLGEPSFTHLTLEWLSKSLPASKVFYAKLVLAFCGYTCMYVYGDGAVLLHLVTFKHYIHVQAHLINSNIFNLWQCHVIGNLPLIHCNVGKLVNWCLLLPSSN